MGLISFLQPQKQPEVEVVKQELPVEQPKAKQGGRPKKIKPVEESLDQTNLEKE